MGKILTLKKAVKKKVGEINTPNLPFIYPCLIGGSAYELGGWSSIGGISRRYGRSSNVYWLGGSVRRSAAELHSVAAFLG